MSDQHSGARHVDPLDALRATDRRPHADVWRERLSERVQRGLSTDLRRALTPVFLGVVAAAVIWQLFAAADPPVESSIPLATVATERPASAAGLPEPADTPSGDGGEPEATSVSHTEAVVVHVAGEVTNPGLVVGSPGWRVDDVIRAAGGPTAMAELDRLNLAALIADGQRIFVPAVGEQEPTVVEPDGSGAVNSVGESPVIDINSADITQLQTLPGIGPATASTIVAHRSEYGNFANVDALVAVRGIGPATLEALREHIRVG